MLPPDMDSNQTLTASCRADVWAGATLETAGHSEGEMVAGRGGGNNSTSNETHGEKGEQKHKGDTERVREGWVGGGNKNQKELLWRKDGGIGVGGLQGALGCGGGTFFFLHPNPQRNLRRLWMTNEKTEHKIKDIPVKGSRMK